MVNARLASDAPRLGPLQMRDSVRQSLLALRHFTRVALPALAPPWPADPPGLELGRVAEVERALECQLPDEILACLANDDDELSEFGFTLGLAADHTRDAHRRGCPAALVAVGRHPDGHAFYCVTRDGPRDRHVRLLVRDEFDGGLVACDLADWLAVRVEGRREALTCQYPMLADWVPTPAEVADFVPTLLPDADGCGTPGPAPETNG